MANEFSGIEPGGILKTSYDSGDSPMSEALRRKRQKMVEKRWMSEDKKKSPEDQEVDE